MAYTINLINDLTPDSWKWYGTILQSNGKIYGIPSTQTQILEFDPNTHEINLFGEFGRDGKWHDGVLQSNGKIYGISFNQNQVLEFNPNTHQINLFGDLIGRQKWYGGALQPNGKIYAMPLDQPNILEIDIRQNAIPEIDDILYPPFIPKITSGVINTVNHPPLKEVGACKSSS